MFPLLIPIAAGAVGGALMNKKKPLNGALLGAGLGAGAGAAFPAMGGLLGGASAAAPATAAASSPGFAIGQPLVTGSLGSSATAGAASPGLLSSVNSTLSQYKPVMDAASTGLSMSGAMNQEQPMQAPEVQQVQGGSQTLAQLAGQDGGAAQMQVGAQDRERRRQAIRGGM
jgi:hypothetical protein